MFAALGALQASNFKLSLAERPVALRSGIGSAHDAVSTTSKEAQAFYDQGLAYLHSYVWLEAARSFNQALRLDLKLALAHLGLTIAYTELNAAAADARRDICEDGAGRAARASHARAQSPARRPHRRGDR